MILALLLIAVFILGMITGAVVLAIVALNMDKKEKIHGNDKKESGV